MNSRYAADKQSSAEDWGKESVYVHSTMEDPCNKTDTFDMAIGNTGIELDEFLHGTRHVTVRAHTAAAVGAPLTITLS